MAKKKKELNKDLWFKKLGADSSNWGIIPVSWKGWVSLILLAGLNVFAANYFNLNEMVLDNYLKMGVVFLLSIFVFIEIAKGKTKK